VNISGSPIKQSEGLVSKHLAYISYSSFSAGGLQFSLMTPINTAGVSGCEHRPPPPGFLNIPIHSSGHHEDDELGDEDGEDDVLGDDDDPDGELDGLDEEEGEELGEELLDGDDDDDDPDGEDDVLGEELGLLDGDDDGLDEDEEGEEELDKEELDEEDEEDEEEELEDEEGSMQQHRIAIGNAMIYQSGKGREGGPSGPYQGSTGSVGSSGGGGASSGGQSYSCCKAFHTPSNGDHSTRTLHSGSP
jgi:uncharacterized membrane protein YgcG